MRISIIIWSVWFASEILLNRLVRSSKQQATAKDAGTLQMMWRLIGIGITLGILATIYIPVFISTSNEVRLVGLTLIVAGMILRFSAIRSLGRYFTVDVAITRGHRIKTDGLYSIVRHPSYTAMLISFLGFGLSLNNMVSVIAIILPVAVSIIIRIRVEETALTEQFGEEYTQYCTKTKRLLPWIY